MDDSGEMAETAETSRGISSLPNELLYTILDPLPTSALLILTSVSKRFHALALRIFYSRLSIAAGLNDHTLLLECYHPSARLFAGQLYCHSLGTAGLETALDGVAGNGTYEVGKIANLCALYSRFRPQHKEPERRASVRHRAGDIPGSRTYPSTAVSSTQTLDAETRLVSDTVSLDAHELFSQLCTVTNLVKMGPKRGLLLSIVEVGDGTIRVWRDWLAKQAEARVGLIDTGEPVIGGSGSFQSEADPTNDPSILWVNNSDNAVGIKFRVRKHQWRRDNPILFSSEEEVAVSYQVEFEELVVKTSHLLRKIEESAFQQENISGKAVVFGAFG